MRKPGLIVSNGIKVKPMSVNQSYLGRKVKSAAYHKYEKLVLSILEFDPVPEKGLLEIDFVFGVSSKLADLDNPIKALMDLLQKLHTFNDNRVFKLSAVKKLVPKGEEFFHYSIFPYIGNINLKLEDILSV